MKILPVKVSNIYRTLGSVRKSLEDSARILLIGGSTAALKELEALLKPEASRGRVIRHRLDPAEGHPPVAYLIRDTRPDLAMVVFSAGDTVDTGLVEVALELENSRVHWLPVVTFTEAEDLVEQALLAVSLELGMDPDQIAVVEPVSGSGSAQWADLMVRTAPEDRWLALGASFSLLREPIATRVIGKVALQNGAIATLGFTPGADIAVLTANQVRMVLEIAGLYGEELSAERAKEILATIGGAFLLRAAARQMLGLIPIAGWAVKGAVGYLGTVAIGRAALVYFANPEARERLTDKLSTLAERAQTAFRPESDVQASDNEVLPVVQNL